MRIDDEPPALPTSLHRVFARTHSNPVPKESHPEVDRHAPRFSAAARHRAALRAQRRARSLLSIAAAIALSDCTDTPAQPYNEPLARRCADLLAIFDKYGVQHSQGSGGPDIIYVGAGIDCRNGRYAQGIQAMEDLLQRNKIPYPPA